MQFNFARRASKEFQNFTNKIIQSFYDRNNNSTKYFCNADIYEILNIFFNIFTIVSYQFYNSLTNVLIHLAWLDPLQLWGGASIRISSKVSQLEVDFDCVLVFVYLHLCICSFENVFVKLAWRHLHKNIGQSFPVSVIRSKLIKIRTKVTDRQGPAEDNQGQSNHF